MGHAWGDGVDLHVVAGHAVALVDGCSAKGFHGLRIQEIYPEHKSFGNHSDRVGPDPTHILIKFRIQFEFTYIKF